MPPNISANIHHFSLALSNSDQRITICHNVTHGRAMSSVCIFVRNIYPILTDPQSGMPS